MKELGEWLRKHEKTAIREVAKSVKEKFVSESKWSISQGREWKTAVEALVYAGRTEEAKTEIRVWQIAPGHVEIDF